MPRHELTAADVIRLLDLAPLPVEGGYYRETYTGELQLPANVLPPEIGSNRSVSSAIYYLLTVDSKSRLHRLVTDEIWHFYLGEPVDLFVFRPEGVYTKIELGHRIGQGQSVQAVVPAKSWFGARLRPGGEWALMACSLAPAYSEADFSLPDAAEFDALLARFPSHKQILLELR